MNQCELCFKPIRFWDWKTYLKSNNADGTICLSWFHRRCTMGKCLICNKSFHRWQNVNHCIYEGVEGIGHQKCLNAKGVELVELSQWINDEDEV